MFIISAAGGTSSGGSAEDTASHKLVNFQVPINWNQNLGISWIQSSTIKCIFGIVTSLEEIIDVCDRDEVRILLGPCPHGVEIRIFSLCWFSKL